MYLEEIKMQVVKEKTKIKYDGRQLNNPGIINDVIRDFFTEDRSGVEKMVVLSLDTKNKIIGLNVASVGTLNSAVVHPREIFKSAIVNNANSIVIAHNHPSGDLEPSREDILITRRLKEAGELLGIKLLDSLVCSYDGQYLSFLQENLL